MTDHGFEVTAEFGRDYWAWRAAQQPRSPHDIPRITRPDGWLPRWSASDVDGYRRDLAEFEARLDTLPATDNRAELVDRRLLGSACARVHWELDVLCMWQTQPRFYVDQTIGNVFDLLTEPHPDAERLSRIADVLRATRAVLDDARINLTGHAVGEFGRLAVAELGDIEEQVRATVRALIALPAAAGTVDRLTSAGEDAAAALGDYRDWLQRTGPKMTPMRPIGRRAFQWFLIEVALIPSTPQEILATGRAELDPAITMETLERNRRDAERVERILHLAAADVIDERPDGSDEDVHFPQALAHAVIDHYSSPGETVLDPFAGWGTTLVVAEKLGRSAIGVELVPERVAAIKRRVSPSAVVLQADARNLNNVHLGQIDLCFPAALHERDRSPAEPAHRVLDTRRQLQHLPDRTDRSVHRGVAPPADGRAPGDQRGQHPNWRDRHPTRLGHRPRDEPAPSFSERDVPGMGPTANDVHRRLLPGLPEALIK